MVAWADAIVSVSYFINSLFNIIEFVNDHAISVTRHVTLSNIWVSIICRSFTMKIRKIFHSPLIEPCDIHEISRCGSRKPCSVVFSLSAGKVWNIVYQVVEKNVSPQVCHSVSYPIAMTNRISFITTEKQRAMNQILKVMGFCIKVSLKTISIVVFWTRKKIIFLV